MEFRIINFSVCEKVKIRQSTLTGTIIKIGGLIATVQIDGEPINLVIPISRLRHITPIGIRAMKYFQKSLKTIKNRINEL